MRTRKPAVVLTVMSLVIAGLVVPQAGAATPLTVTVTPASDLVDGQTIHVAIANVAPGDGAYSSLCVAGTAPANSDCDQYVFGFGTAGDDGTVAFDVAVDAVFQTLTGDSVDCRVAPGCTLVTSPSGTDVSPTVTSLAFRPDGPLLPPPTLTVTPSDDLVDGTSAHVTGSGFVASSSVMLVQCLSPFTTFSDCNGARIDVTADADGALDATLTLSTVLYTVDGIEVDCRVAACELVATRDIFNVEMHRTATAPLSFRADGPLLPPPVLTVAPDQSLVGGQEVQVSGTGFRSGSLLVGQCVRRAGAVWERCTTQQFISVDADGAFTTPLRLDVVARVATGFVDCRTTPGCTVAAFDINSGHLYAEVPVAFDPDGPVPPPPTLHVFPEGPLAARSPVIVAGAGFPPFTEVGLQRCALVNGLPDECTGFGGDYVQTDADGKLLAGLVVTAVVGGNDGTEIDCRVVTCALVGDAYAGSPAIAPLQFQPSTTPRTRYLAPVFDDVDVTSDVVYRHTTDSHGAPIDLALDIYRPAGDPATKRPAVMWMFGGYFGSGEKGQLRDHAMAMARRGYVSVAITYRTRPEIFGGGHGCVPVGGTCLDPTQLAPAIIDARDDARAAMVWLHDHATEYGIEPRAITAAGWSAGAVTALNLAHDATDDRAPETIPAAAVSLAGILTAAPGAGDPPSLMMGGNHDSLLAMNAQIAGCGLIESAGSKCEFVAYAGFRPDASADECVRAAVPCTYVTGRDGEHGFLFEERPDVIDRMSKFLATAVLEPVGLLPRRHHHHRPPHPRHHHHHRHHRRHHHHRHH